LSKSTTVVSTEVLQHTHAAFCGAAAVSLVLMHEVQPKRLSGAGLKMRRVGSLDVVKSWLSMTQPGMRPEGVAVTEVKSVTEPKLAIAAWQSDSWVIVVSPAASHDSALGFCDVKSVPNHVHPPTVANSVHVSSVVVLGAEAKQCASSPAGHAARASASVSYAPVHVAISTGQSGGETGGGAAGGATTQWQMLGLPSTQ